MKRVAIIGCGGSGKSTLARKLGDQLGIEVVHLDRHYWRAGWIAVADDEWDRIHKQLVVPQQWIIDGNFGRTMDSRLELADTVIFLDFPRWLCLSRVIWRRILYWRRTRPDMAPGCRETLDREFLAWIWTYRRTRRPGVLRKLERLPCAKRVVILRSRREVSAFLEMVGTFG